jgi:hypothetical protein
VAEPLKFHSHHKAATLADGGREAGVLARAASAVLNGALTVGPVAQPLGGFVIPVEIRC